MTLSSLAQALGLGPPPCVACGGASRACWAVMTAWPSHCVSVRPTGQKPLAGEGLVVSLDQIRAVLSIHPALVRLALERLQLNHRLIRYE